MKTRVQKWGNSLALRIPKSFAAEAGLHADAGLHLLDQRSIDQPPEHYTRELCLAHRRRYQRNARAFVNQTQHGLLQLHLEPDVWFETACSTSQRMRPGNNSISRPLSPHSRSLPAASSC